MFTLMFTLMLCGCYSTGTAPMTMNIYIDPELCLNPVSATTVQADILTMAAAAAATPSIGGVTPATAPTPVCAFAPLPGGLNFPPTGTGKLAYATQKANDFVAYDNAPLANIPGLGVFGRPAKWMNTGMVAGTHDPSGIQCKSGITVTLTPTQGTPPLPPAVTVTLKASDLGHITAYTILHELIWHKVGGNIAGLPGSGDGDCEPGAPRLGLSGVHIGVNKWYNIVPHGFVIPVGTAPVLFPPVRDEELAAWGLQLGYIED